MEVVENVLWVSLISCPSVINPVLWMIKNILIKDYNQQLKCTGQSEMFLTYFTAAKTKALIPGEADVMLNFMYIDNNVDTRIYFKGYNSFIFSLFKILILLRGLLLTTGVYYALVNEIYCIKISNLMTLLLKSVYGETSVSPFVIT